MAVKKERADRLICELKLCESREQAKKMIMAGQVRIGSDHVVGKCSEMVPVDAELNIIERCPFVSRGAYKLLPAIERFCPDLKGKTALDVGASTGGFTDLMLQHGAAKVITVDVGTGQLHGKLRRDPRVVCYEQVNARYLKPDFLAEPVDIITMDLSFISVTTVLPAVAVFLKKGGLAFILVKPQFEAGKDLVEKGGVVKSVAVRNQCNDKVSAFAEKQLHWQHLATIPSPIKGPKGNQESIVVLQHPQES